MLTPQELIQAKRVALKLFLFAVLLLAVDRLSTYFFKQGLYRYYGLDRPAKILLVGHSHAMLGIDQALLSRGLGGPVAKFTLPGTNIYEHRAMVKMFYNEHPGDRTPLVFDVHSYSFSRLKVSANSRVLFYPYMDDPDMDAYLGRVTPSRLDYFLLKYLHLLRYNSHEVLAAMVRGYTGHEDESTYLRMRTPLATLRKEPPEDRKIRIDPDELACFDDMVGFVRSRNIPVILLGIPTVDYLSEKERPKHDAVFRILKGYADRDPGITLLDYNPGYDQKLDWFQDEVHLNHEGRMAVTATFLGDLKKIVP